MRGRPKEATEEFVEGDFGKEKKRLHKKLRLLWRDR